MKKELEEKLFNDFPNMFRGHNHSDLKKTLMPFGFSHGDGWFDLVYNLCKDIQARIDKGLESKDFIVLQVKEKFAGLRFYVGSATKETFDLIHKAEEESYKICEKCGSRENVNVRVKAAWYKTLCDKCAGKEWRIVKW